MTSTDFSGSFVTLQMGAASPFHVMQQTDSVPNKLKKLKVGQEILTEFLIDQRTNLPCYV